MSERPSQGGVNAHASHITAENAGYVSATDEQVACDDGLTPRQRAAIKWDAMKKSLSDWWSQNWPNVLAALPPLMTVIGGLFTGVMAVQVAGRVRDFLQKGWDGEAQCDGL